MFIHRTNVEKMAAFGVLNVLSSELPRKRRIYRRQLNPRASFTDFELRSRYHFGRGAINFIAEPVTAEITPSTSWSHSVSAGMHVFVTLTEALGFGFLQVYADTFLGLEEEEEKAEAAKLGDFIRFLSTGGERD